MTGRRGAGRGRRGAALGLLLLSSAAGADLTFDGSLGPVDTLSGDMIVDPSFGTLAGTNLFHSFEHLSVESGESLHFSADALLVENIIGRVTGVDATFLDGPVSADANLFVVNPNGVILGAGASFDPSVIIEFAAADTVFFDDGSAFRVRDTNAAATLSIAAPDDFGFVSIATDDTLAPASVLLDDEQGQALIDADAGTRSGASLFLSFEAFALYPEQAALFLLGSDVEHVVARVTSLEDSLFNGSLTLLDETTFEIADSALWFTNPNGLLVGPGVFLDGVPALHLGVADTVAFADGTRFGVSGTEPLPTDASPVAFETGAATGALTVSSALLDPERSLSLVGPDISILDAQLESPELHLEASGSEGRLEIVGASLEALPGGAGEAPRLAIIGERLVRIVESEAAARSGELEVMAPEIEIDSSLLDASSATPDEQAGMLRLEGSDILVTEGTLLAARADGGDAGLVTLSADAALRVEAGSSIDVSSRGAGRAGEIELSAPVVEVAESALLADSAPGFGLSLTAAAAGFSDVLDTDLPTEDPRALVDALRPILADGFGLDLFADTPAGLVAELEAGVDPVDLADFEDALPFFLSDFAQLAPDDVGGAGVIVVFGDSVSLTDVVLSTDSFASAVTEPSVILLEARDALTLTGVQAQADTAGPTDGGTIVAVGDTVRIIGSQLRTLAIPDSSGDAGFIQILGNSIEIRDGTEIGSVALNDGGSSGAVLLEAQEDVRIEAANLITSVLGAGDAGLLSISAPEISIDSSFLASTSEATDPLATETGAAGNLELLGGDIAITRSTLSTTTAADDADPSSLVVMATDRLLIDESELSADTLGAAAAGDVLLSGADVDIIASQVFAESFATGTGDAGNVEVAGERITVRDSLLTSRTNTGTGDAGTVILRAGERIELSGETDVDTNAAGTGTAGDILLSAPDLLVLGADVMSASAPSPVLPLLVVDAARALSEALGTALPEDDADALLAAAVPLLADAFDVELPEGTPRDQLARLLFSAEQEALDLEAGLPFTLAALGDLGNGPAPPAVVGGAGTIRLEGARIVLEGDALVSAITAASAGVEPGVVEIEASESIAIDDAVLESDTIGAGDAGDVFLSAPRIDIARASLFAESFDTGRGDAGNVIVEGGDIHVTSGSLLASRAQAGVGDGGNVILDATGTLRIDGGATIESSSSGSGDAGLVFATAPDLEITDATLRSASERFEDTPLLVEFAVVLFDRAFGTTLEAETPETFIAAVTPLFEDALDIDLAATEPAAFVAELERKADQDDLDALFDPLPFDPEDLQRLTDAPRLVETVGDAGVVSLRGARITLSGANLSTITAATESGIPSDVVLEATERLEVSSSTIEADTIGVASAGNITLTGGELVIDGVLRSRSTKQAPLPLNLRQAGTALGIDATDLDAAAFLATLIPVLEAETGASLDAGNGAELLLQVLTRGDLERIEALEDRLTEAGSDLLFLELLKAPIDGELGGAGTLTLSGSSIRLDGAELTTEAASTLDAAAASILLIAEQDLDLDTSLLTATTSGLSRAGDIELSGARLDLADTLLTAESLVSATGDAGSVSLNGDALGLTGSTITSRSTSPTAAAGSITLRLANAATLDAGSVLTTSSSGAGAAGDIDVSAATLLLREGSLILSESEGTGASGSINLELGTRLDMFDSRLSTNALRARGGDIVVRTLGSEIFLTRSRIEASAGADGRGGDVLLDSDFIVLEESALLATAVDGNGGQIDIFADAVVSDFFSTISADSQTGNAGTVNIEAPDNDMNAVVAAQDASPLVVPELVSDRCAPGAEAGSRLIVRPATPVRSLPESPRSLDALEARLEVSALLLPCTVGGR